MAIPLSANIHGLSNGNFNIFGTRSSGNDRLERSGFGQSHGCAGFIFNAGGDTIVLSGTASDYSIVRSGRASS